MAARKKLVGIAALIGFLACTAWSAGLVSSGCCSPSCEPCPVIVCKSTAATTSPKVDVTRALLPASFGELFKPSDVSASIASFAPIPAFLPHEFRRPMRN